MYAVYNLNCAFEEISIFQCMATVLICIHVDNHTNMSHISCLHLIIGVVPLDHGIIIVSYKYQVNQVTVLYGITKWNADIMLI